MEKRREFLMSEICFLKDIYYLIDEIIELKEDELNYLSDIANRRFEPDDMQEDEEYDRFIQRLWYDVREILKVMMSTSEFETWIEPLVLQTIYDDVAYLFAPNDFAVHWLNTHYSSLIKKTLSKTLQDNIEVSILCEDSD